MTFALGFYSFNINLNDATREVYTSFRIKTARHREESLEYLYARILAFAHCYEEGLAFSQGLFELRDPAIWKKDILGNIDLWVDLGVPDKKKLERALKANPKGNFRIYFYAPEQIVNFCWMLRGSKTNWIENITFCLLDRDLLEDLAITDSSSSTWDLNIFDGMFFLNAQGHDFSSSFQPVDIWDEFQISIANQGV